MRGAGVTCQVPRSSATQLQATKQAKTSLFRWSRISSTSLTNVKMKPADSSTAAIVASVHHLHDVGRSSLVNMGKQKHRVKGVVELVKDEYRQTWTKENLKRTARRFLKLTRRLMLSQGKHPII